MANKPLRIRPTRKKDSGGCNCGKKIRPNDPRRKQPQRTIKKRF